MATNPITSDSLTLDFKQLMRIPIGNRVQLAMSSSSFLQLLVNSLTPIQIAKAFPDYYKRALPDISNFILANRYFDAGGQAHQTGGGEGGSAYPYYDQGNNVNGSAMPAGSELSIEDMKKKLLEKGIDVEGTYSLLKEGPILAGDPRLQYIKNMTNDQLLAAGIQKVEDENGKSMFQLAPSKYDNMTDEEIAATMRSGAGKDSDYIYDEKINKDKAAISRVQVQAQLIREAKEQGIDLPPERAKIIAASIAGQANRESNYNPKAIHDQNTGLGMYGHRDDPRGRADDPNSRRRTFALKWMEENRLDPNSMEAWNRYAAHEIMTLPRFKGLKKELLEGDITLEHATQRVADIFEAPAAPERAPGSDSMRVRQEGAKWALEEPKLSPDAKIAGENEQFTPEQIKARREELRNLNQKVIQERTIREIYNQASPTSSEYVQAPGDTRTSTILDSRVEELQAGFRKLPIKPELKNSLDYAAEMSGIEVEVFSGGQDHQIHDQMEAAGHESSYRHNIDIPGTPGAADVILYYRDENGKKVPLSVTNPEHSSKIANFTENFTRVVPSAGVGSNYMKTGGYIDPTKIHYGGPNAPEGQATTWGNMPDYMREAHQRGVALRNEDLKSDRDPLKEWVLKKEEERRKKEEQSKTAENITPKESPVPQFALGGNMYGLNEDMTLVETETGKPIAQIGQNEKIEKQGNAIQVTPETKLKADELAEKYDTSSDVETRMNDMEDRIDQQQEAVSQVNRKPIAPDRVDTSPSNHWREAIKEADRPVSPSFHRAIARSKFFPEGHHFNRSSPGSISK